TAIAAAACPPASAAAMRHSGAQCGYRGTAAVRPACESRESAVAGVSLGFDLTRSSVSSQLAPLEAGHSGDQDDEEPAGHPQQVRGGWCSRGIEGLAFPPAARRSPITEWGWR